MNPISDDDLRWLLQLLEEQQLAEIEVREGTSKVVVRATQAVAADSRSDESRADQSADELELDDHHIPVLSPFAGMFYRSSTPDSNRFVEIGDHVVHGDTVGLVEAMKLFNEIPASATGVVNGILADNGQQVAADEVLMVIETMLTEDNSN